MAYKGTVGEQIQKLLDEYTEEAIKRSDADIRKVAEESAQKLQDRSPSASGDYAKGWTTKVLKKGKFVGIFAHTGQYVVHNKTDYHLTHLLEYGHDVIRDGKKIGRANPHEHIAPVEQWAESELPDRIKGDI